MASGDFVTPSNRKIRIGDVEANRPNSESVNQKVGGSLNYILDRLFFDMKFAMNGYFKDNNYDDGVGGIQVIENDCKISRYFLALYNSGTSGTTSFNVAIYDSSGAFVNALFGGSGNALTISGSNGTNVLIGKKGIDTISPSNFATNIAGHTVQYGSLNVTTLLAGYVLVPYIISNGVKALNCNFALRCKEL